MSRVKFSSDKYDPKEGLPERKALTAAELREQTTTRRLVQLILELSLMSHVRGRAYDGSPSSGKIETVAPTGGIDWAGDRETEYRQKSAEHFARRLNRLLSAVDADKLDDETAKAAVEELHEQATQALRDWRRTPVTPGHDPARDTRGWKIRIANDKRSTGVVAGHYGVSRTTVWRYRHQYGGLEE